MSLRQLSKARCSWTTEERVTEAYRRRMTKARSQPSVPVHHRRTRRETEQTNPTDVSLLSVWRIREGVSQADRQSSRQSISRGGIPQMIPAVCCWDCRLLCFVWFLLSFPISILIEWLALVSCRVGKLNFCICASESLRVTVAGCRRSAAVGLLRIERPSLSSSAHRLNNVCKYTGGKSEDP